MIEDHLQALELDAMVEKIRAREPFALARFGDGEWRALTGYKALMGKNCDGQPHADVAADLARVLRARPSYYLGIQPFALRVVGDELRAWLSKEGLDDLQWWTSDAMHRASMRDRLGPFISAIAARDVVLVGPAHLGRWNGLRHKLHVVVPDGGRAHSERDRIVDLTASACGMLEAPFVSVSAGMSAKGIVHDLHARLGESATIVDVGSLWDPYAGVASRAYHAAVVDRLAKAAS